MSEVRRGVAIPGVVGDAIFRTGAKILLPTGLTINSGNHADLDGRRGAQRATTLGLVLSVPWVLFVESVAETVFADGKPNLTFAALAGVAKGAEIVVDTGIRLRNRKQGHGGESVVPTSGNGGEAH